MGHRIRLARTQAGYPVASHFARAIEVSVTTLWRYERGYLKPGADVLARIARVCGVSIDWLVTGAESASRRSDIERFTR